MREPVDRERIERFFRELGTKARESVRVYLAGGATAVLFGWRSSTIDIDLKMVPDSDPLLRALPLELPATPAGTRIVATRHDRHRLCSSFARCILRGA